MAEWFNSYTYSEDQLSTRLLGHLVKLILSSTASLWCTLAGDDASVHVASTTTHCVYDPNICRVLHTHTCT